MKPYLIFIFLIVTIFGCKKNSTDNPQETKALSGKVDTANVSSSDIIVSSEIDKSALSSDGAFKINPHSVLIAKSKSTNNPIYFGFPGTDENTNYSLDAKETALYFTLAAIPNVRRQYYKPYVKKIKQAIYQYQEVKNLETKIKQSINQLGYLDYDLIGNEIGLAVDKVLTTTKAESSTYTAGRVIIDPNYSSTGGFYRVSDETPTDWTDQFDAAISTYKIKRKMFNSTAAVVGVQIGKYNKPTNTVSLPNKYIGFIEPYYPPNLASVDGTISNLEQFWEATYDLATNGWNGLANSDAYSKDNEFIFDAKKDEKDAVIFVNGYYDPHTMRGINIAYILIDNFQDIFEKATGNNLFSKNDFVNGFLGDLASDAVNAADLANYYVWFIDKNYDLIISNLQTKLEKYATKIGTWESQQQLEFFKDQINTNFKILAGSWAKVYKYSRIIYKIASMVQISDSKKFAGFVPIEFDNLTLPLSPYQPSPFNVTLNNVSLINFQWQIKNPQNQALKYNVYLSNTISGLTTNKIASDISNTNFNYTASLVANTRYYWQVEITNQFNEKRLGAIWTFDNGNAISQTTQGLVAYYPFNGNTLDQSNMGNNGTLTGSASLSNDRKSNNNSNSLSVGGFNSMGYLSIFSSPSLQFQNNNGCTFSFWVKLNNWGVQWQALFGKGGDGGSAGPGLYSVVQGGNNNSTTLAAAISGNGGTLLNPILNYSILNQWHHIVVQYKTGSQKMFVDAIEVATNNGVLDFTNSNDANLFFGAYNSGWYSLDGYFDDIRIYNRILSNTEITSLYNE